MTTATRRDALLLAAGAMTSAAAGATLHVRGARAQPEPRLRLVPEKGATLNVMRPSRFVQGDEALWMENTRRYTKETGVEVRVIFETWEELRAKASTAANMGRGPDIVCGFYDDAHLFPEKLLDLADVADYLGKKYGGWYEIAQKFGVRDRRWIALPLGGLGVKMVHRASWTRAAGFDEFPKDLPGLLKLCRALKEAGHPPGFALGNATGDANYWCHWLVWAHGGKLVDDSDRVVINSPQTIAALEYATELYKTFVPGTLSWLDADNNREFLAGNIGLTSNGISIYYPAKSSSDPALRELSKDIAHADFPNGPSGQPTEAPIMIPAFAFSHTKYPNAAKDYLRWMMEREQYVPWQEASGGYWAQPLAGYDAKVWMEDPKITPFRDALKNQRWPGYSGSLGFASASCLTDFVIVNMIAVACSGAKTPKEAAAEAQRRTEKYYKI